MKATLATLFTLALAFSTTGCFQHTYDIGTGAPEGEIVYKHWHHHWLFGLIRPDRQKTLEVDDFCPSGNATIHSETSFVNGLIDVLIGIIYSPTTVTITCDEGGAQAEVEVSAEQAARIVRDPRFIRLVEEVAPERLAEVRGALGEVGGGRTETRVFVATR